MRYMGHVSAESGSELNRMTSVELLDEAALAACGYKQEFKRYISSSCFPGFLILTYSPTHIVISKSDYCAQRTLPMVLILRIIRRTRYPPQRSLHTFLLSWLLRNSRAHLGLDHRLRWYSSCCKQYGRAQFLHAYFGRTVLLRGRTRPA